MEILTKDNQRLIGVTKIQRHHLMPTIVIFHLGDRKVLSVGEYIILKY